MEQHRRVHSAEIEPFPSIMQISFVTQHGQPLIIEQIIKSISGMPKDANGVLPDEEEGRHGDECVLV